MSSQMRQALLPAAFVAWVLLLALGITGSTQAEDLSAALGSAEQRAATGEAEIREAQKAVGPAAARYAAIAHQAIPARRKARSAQQRLGRLEAAAVERRRNAAAQISRIEADHQQKVDDHEEQVQGAVGLGLVTLVIAAITLSWGWFRASAAVAWLTRLPVHQAIGLCVSGALVVCIAGATLSAEGGILGALGVFLALLAPVLAIALTLARHSVEVQSGRSKALLKRERLPRSMQRTTAAVLLFFCLAALGAVIASDAPHAAIVPIQLRRQVNGVQSDASKRVFADVKAKAAHLDATAYTLSTRQRTAGEALRRAKTRLHRAEGRLAAAQHQLRYYTHRIAVLEERELREAERAQRQAEREAERQEEEEFEEPTSGGCDPNYTGCVPDTGYDVDCSEVNGPVEVIGTDVDGLDADNDGVGCES